MKRLVVILGISGVLASALFAQSFSYTESVKVEKSEPVYRTITKRVPYQECWDEEVPVSNSGNSGNAGALIGGVAGGVLGHQVGKGGGKTAATIGGAILGTIVGKNLSDNSNSNQVEYRKVRRCRTRYNESQETIKSGYKNIAYYNGQKIIKYSSRPLSNIRVNVTISY